MDKGDGAITLPGGLISVFANCSFLQCFVITTGTGGSIQFDMEKYYNTYRNPFKQSPRHLIFLCFPGGPLMHRWNAPISLSRLN